MGIRVELHGGQVPRFHPSSGNDNRNHATVEAFGSQPIGLSILPHMNEVLPLRGKVNKPVSLRRVPCVIVGVPHSLTF